MLSCCFHTFWFSVTLMKEEVVKLVCQTESDLLSVDFGLPRSFPKEENISEKKKESLLSFFLCFNVNSRGQDIVSWTGIHICGSYVMGTPKFGNSHSSSSVFYNKQFSITFLLPFLTLVVFNFSPCICSSC